MSVEENKRALRRWIDPPGGWEQLNRQIFEAKDPKAKLAEFYKKAKDELFAADFIYHTTRGDMDLNGYVQYDSSLWSAMPDLNMSIKEMIGEGDWIMARITMSGTHKGTLYGIPSTGKKIDAGGMVACRLVGGKFAEVWTYMDLLGIMQQMGIIPKMGQK